MYMISTNFSNREFRITDFEYDSSDNPTAHIDSYDTILEHMTSKLSRNMISENKEMYNNQSNELRGLTFKLIVEKFNQKYKNLSQQQKNLINRFITENTSLEPFREFFHGEVRDVRKRLTMLTKGISDKALKIKLSESNTLLNEILTSKHIKDEHLSAMLKYYELVDVLGGEQ